MRAFKDFPYPINIAVSIFGDLTKVPNYLGFEDSMKYAIERVITKSRNARMAEFIHYRYEDKMTYKNVAKAMNFAGPERPRQIDAQFHRLMRSQESMSIMINGIDDGDKYIDDVGGIMNLSLRDMDVDIRSFNAITRYWRYHGDQIPAGDITGKHIVQLFQEKKLLGIRDLGIKTINNRLIPRLKFLGFTDEQLALNEKGEYEE